VPEPLRSKAYGDHSLPIGYGQTISQPSVVGLMTQRLSIDPGVESMIPVGGGDLAGLRTLHARFGSDEVVVLALHSDTLFSRESLERLDRLTACRPIQIFKENP